MKYKFKLNQIMNSFFIYCISHEIQQIQLLNKLIVKIEINHNLIKDM